MYAIFLALFGKAIALIHPSWDNLYERELDNNANDEDDEGIIWFSESNAEKVVLRQLSKLHKAGLLERSHDGSDIPPSRFLDLGTGNGHMLFELREEDEEDESWCGEMIGVDYSESSVQLAQRIAEQKQAYQSNLDRLSFECWDLLQSPPGDWLADGFDVVLDKGTFDAISLIEHTSDAASPCQVYREKVTPLLKPGGFLFVTSCNWTKQELVQWLAPNDGELAYYDEARYPTFTFAGQTGQTIVTVVFRRNGG